MSEIRHLLLLVFCIISASAPSLARRHNASLEDDRLRITFLEPDPDLDIVEDPAHQEIVEPEHDVRPTFRQLIDFHGISLLSGTIHALNCAIEKQACYPRFGCFNNRKGPLRELCKLPRPPHELQTEFRLYLKSRRKELEIHYEDRASWRQVPRDSRIVIMIHGNYETSDFPITYMIKDELLK